jgi:hypothetical protein
MTDLRRGAIGALALGAAALISVGLGAEAHAFTFTWAGHGEAHADAPAAERRFTFPWASHVDVHSADYAAQQFVQKQLPPGLPMAQAVSRAREARSSCRDAGAAVICRYEISAASDGASLGQEVWILTLTPGPDGKLATAAVERRRSGLGGDLGARAVFHFEFGQ